MDIVITYETLFDLLRKEKGRAELQELPEDFYGRVLGYLRGKQAASSQKELIQVRNAQRILRELYERRERKIIEMGLNRARAERNLIDTGALLPQEQAFYEQVATLLKTHRRELLELVLAGEAPAGVVVPEPPAAGEAEEPSEEAPPPVAEAPTSFGSSCNVRFLASVPKFLGLGGTVHGPFEPGDEAELPGKIAEVLVRKNRAEVV